MSMAGQLNPMQPSSLNFSPGDNCTPLPQHEAHNKWGKKEVGWARGHAAVGGLYHVCTVSCTFICFVLEMYFCYLILGVVVAAGLPSNGWLLYCFNTCLQIKPFMSSRKFDAISASHHTIMTWDNKVKNMIRSNYTFLGKHYFSMLLGTAIHTAITSLYEPILWFVHLPPHSLFIMSFISTLHCNQDHTPPKYWTPPPINSPHKHILTGAIPPLPLHQDVNNWEEWNLCIFKGPASTNSKSCCCHWL